MIQRVDLLIVGGGIYGATAAYEASRRGLSVLVIDRSDFGAGASSNSMGIAHGGLRYLRSLDFRRCFESIQERRRLILLAPQWVRPLPVRMITEGRSTLYRLALRGGLLLNELISIHRNRGVPRTHRLPSSAYPGWYDAIIEDTERVLLTFLHSAIAANPGRTEVRNYTTLERLIHRDGKVVCAQIGGLGEIEVGCVLRCVGATRSDQPVILAMNLVVDQLPFSAEGTAVGLAHPDDGRNIFVVPWRGRSIVGTYYREYPWDPSAPLQVQPAWVDELLGWLKPIHPELARLRRTEVRFVHAGLLPRDPSGSEGPCEQFRIEQCDDGTIDVQGVKWTTAYGVSEKALNLVVRYLGRSEGTGHPTPQMPLVDIRSTLDTYLNSKPGLRDLVLPGRSRLSRGEVLFAVDEQWARKLEDVLLRRTGVAAAGHPGLFLVNGVADLLQRKLDWSDPERNEQVEAFNESFHFAGNVPAA